MDDSEFDYRQGKGFFLLQNVQTKPAAFFPGGKEIEALNLPLT
jgi:hypothetical protein